MTIDFYYSDASAPCRTVSLAARAIGVELNLKPIDFFKGEHLGPAFLKLNPQHTIPTINDNGFAIWESRAIITYLQNQYGKNDSLYPKDPKKRAVVDQRLYFDLDLSLRGSQIYNSKTFTGAEKDPEKLKNYNNSLEVLDTLLGKSEFAAGDNLTLADLSLVTQISNLEIFNHDLTPFKNIKRWLAKVKATAPGYKEENEDKLIIFKQVIEKISKGQFNV